MSRIVDNLVAYRILSMLVTPFEETSAFKLGIIDKTGKNLKKASSLKTTEEKDAYSYLHRLVFNMKKIINKLPGGESKLKSLIAALFLVKEYYESGSRTTSLMEERYVKIMDVLKNNVTLVEEEIIVKRFIGEETSVNEARVDKHEVSGKVVIDGHVFSDAGKSGRSTYGRYSTPDPDYKKDPKEVGLHRNYRRPSSLSFSTLNDAKKWVKTQPKKSAEEIDRVHKKHADFEKYMNEDAPANATGAAVSTDQPKIDKKNIKKYQMMARRKFINASEIKTT
jgi:hypothetical protein